SLIVSSDRLELFLDGPDARLVPPVERPLLDPLATHEAGLGEDFQVLAERGRADPQLPGDEHGADAVLHEVPVDLGREMGSRILQPLENLESLRIPERAEDGG